MKYAYILIFVFIILLVSCVPQEMPGKQSQEMEEQAEKPAQVCTEKWICQDEKTRVYRKSDCTFEEAVDCPAGCENGECKEIIKEEIIEDIKEEETQQQQEPAEPSEQEQIQQIFGYAKTKISSYSYRYKDPAGPQYSIYVKGNRMRIDYLSSNYNIYLDTEKKTAEKYCISYSNCGRETGKVADLDYYDAYINTPIDWLAKITEARKIDDGYYYGKKGWMLDTNIGKVIIDSNFGFIYSIQQNDKAYAFSDAKFNLVENSIVNIPEYLLPK